MFNVETIDGVITKICGDEYVLDFVEKSVSYTTPTGITIMLEDLHGAVTKAVEYNKMKYDLEETRRVLAELKMDRDEARKKYQSNLEKEKNTSRKLNKECNKLTEKIEELERKHEKAKEYIKELEKTLKDTSQELADCRRNNLVLIEQKREFEDVNKHLTKSRDYWHDEWIKLHNDKNALLTANENMSAEIKRLREEISDLNAIDKKLNEKNKEPDIDDIFGISSELVKLISEQTTLSFDEASYSLHDLALIGSPHINNVLNLMNSIASNYKRIDSERRKYQSERDTLKKEISKLENRKQERDEWRDRYLSLKEYHDTTNKTLTDNLNAATKENFELKRALNKTYGICYDNLHDMYPCTYSDAAKEILRWIDGEMKNGTDYATKIFSKESRENIFSITFCKVPVEPEVVANEQG